MVEIEEYNKLAFDEDEYLWKYLDMHKFLSFILKKELFFTRLDKFEDPIEGVTLHSLASKRFFNKKIKYEDMGELDEELKQSYLRTQKLYLENADEQTTKSQITQFANCWFMSKKESVAMWKLYSNCDSVAIKVKPENIINIVKSNAVKIIDTQNKYKLFYDKVSYLDLIPFDLFNRQKSKSPFSSMKKDTSYLHENEFRFGVAKNINGIFKESFSIPIPEIFTDESFGIVTFPNMENWKIENLRDLLRIYKLEDKLTESQLSLRTN